MDNHGKLWAHIIAIDCNTVVQQVFEAPFTISQHKKASNHHANLPLEMYSFTL